MDRLPAGVRSWSFKVQFENLITYKIQDKVPVPKYNNAITQIIVFGANDEVGALVPWCDRVRHGSQWGGDPLIPRSRLVGSHPLVCKYGIPRQRDHHRAPSKQHQESLCIVQVQVFWLLEVIGCLLSKGKTLLGITQRQLSSCREQVSGKNSSVTKQKRGKMNWCWTGCDHEGSIKNFFGPRGPL